MANDSELKIMPTQKKKKKKKICKEGKRIICRNDGTRRASHKSSPNRR